MNVQQQAAGLIRRATVLCLATLVVCTWKLWTPQTEFPRVPVFSPLFVSLPGWLDWLCLFVLLIACSATAVLSARRGRTQWCAVSLVSALLLLVLRDQHRLQPWVLHLAAIAVVTALTSAAKLFTLIRWLTIGIYFHSAVSKFDHSFVTHHGNYLVQGLADAAQLGTAHWSPKLWIFATTAFPCGELLVALLLVPKRCRSAGWILSAIMHCCLLLTLGPSGLDHATPVLIWNVYFLFLALVQLRQNRFHVGQHQSETNVADLRVDGVPPLASGQIVATGLVFFLVALPVLNWEPLNLYDHWPAWSLYSSRGERTYVEIHQEAVSKLPREIQQHLAPAAPLSDWRQLRIDRWSVAALNAPVYPEERFWIGVSSAIAHDYGLDHRIRVRISLVANRLTGDRTETCFEGVQEIDQYARTFWMNANAVHFVE